MNRYLCHTDPQCFAFEARILCAKPGAVLLDRSWFYPGGGGQLADRGALCAEDGGSRKVTGIEQSGGHAWVSYEGPPIPGEELRAEIDREFRGLMCQLHTDLHILNALVFQRFAGALVTGVQMAEDSTARIDFDVPDADSDAIRELESRVNEVIQAGVEVREHYLTMHEVAKQPGLVRSRSVAPPPQSDGTVRVIEIVGVDRQACGGTHLARTSASAPIRILKVDNKGRHNRRVRIGLKK